MVKKIALLILILCICIYAILQTSFVQDTLAEKNIQHDNISDRSKSFLDGQSETAENQWNNADFTEDKPVNPTVVDVDGCFTITVPYVVVTARKDNDCDFHILTDKPKVNIDAYIRNSSVTLDEDTGVVLRRTRKDEYKEYSITLGERRYLIFQRNTGGFEGQAFTQIGSKILVVSMQSYSIEDLSKDYHRMIDSVSITK